MDFDFTPEQKLIEQTARAIADTIIKPLAAEIDQKKIWPEETLNKLAKLGYFGMSIPKEYGGSDLDAVSSTIIMEEFSRACPATATSMGAHVSLCCYPFVAFGNSDQKQKYLPRLAKKEILGAFAITEPNAGSDAANQQTVAVRDGDNYILNGSKIFITNGSKADLIIVMAMTDKSQGHNGISAFIVETKTKGFKAGTTEDKLGIRGADTSEIIFEDLVVPKENLIGKEGDGFKIAMATLDSGRIGIGAQGVGIAQAAYEEALKYAQERVQFKRPIARFQAIQFMLADMATEISAGRALCYRAACLKDKKKKYTTEAAMAKLYGSELAMRTTTKAIQIHGGYGYIKDYPVERFFRDAKITEIYEGTSEIQRLVIASQLLGRGL